MRVHVQKLLFQEAIKQPVKRCGAVHRGARCRDPAEYRVFAKDGEILLCSLDFHELQDREPWKIQGYRKVKVAV